MIWWKSNDDDDDDDDDGRCDNVEDGIAETENNEDDDGDCALCYCLMHLC